MAEFDHIADGCAKATNRQQLDKPAREFGAFLGSLSKDGVLALVGMAGGAIAPRTMPRVEEALTNNVGNVKQILKEGLPKLDEPRLATPNGAPTELPKVSKIKPIGEKVPDNVLLSKAKKTLSGAVPEEHTVNALKAEFKPTDYRFGSNKFKLDWQGMKHILQRHHPEFWDGSVTQKQSFFSTKIKMDELQNAINSVLKQNRKILIQKGTNAKFPIYGEYNGVKYRLGINKGRVGQLYPLE